MKKAIKTIVLILSISTLFYLDFVRDYFFKNVGFQIYYLVHLTDEGTATIANYTDSTLEYFIGNYNIQELINLKWCGAFFFIVVFGSFGSLINYYFHQTKKIFYYFIGTYTLLLFSSLFFYGLTYLNFGYSFQQKNYLISMEIAHFLQSSLPTLLFLVSFKLYKETITKTE